MKINPAETVNELITGLTYIIDIEEKKRNYHAWRVAILSASFAKNILSLQKLKELFYASLLHDIGGVGLFRHIIHYLKSNDKASRDILLSHPIIGAQLVSNIPRMATVAKLILDHHEWINGKGYPRAKLQKYIPWGSQVIRISDSIDIALQSSHHLKLKELQNKMSLTVNKEYSKGLFSRTFTILKRNRFFYKISQRRNIPTLFEEIKNAVGYIYIPLRIDAIGTTLEVVAQIIDMKHPYASGHSLRVSRYAMAYALAMNLKHDEITHIKWAGLIHDIGKLSVPRRILDKPTALTQKEFQEVKKHALFGQKIMEMIPSLKELTPVVTSHHEYFDGSGYPSGLKGKKIPWGARLLATCDAFDAMTSNRPYRKPLTPEATCREIEKNSGTQFDPEIVKQILPLFKNLGL